MADNTTLNPGVGGDVIATDDIGGVKFQRVKMTAGGDGVATDIQLGNSQPPTLAIPVHITSFAPASNVTVSGTFSDTPSTSGGYAHSRIVAGANTNAMITKTGAGQVYGWYFYNNAATTRFVKLYNKASSPTVGTDKPNITIGLPPIGGVAVEYSKGIDFPLGIVSAVTTGIADTDTGATSSLDVIGTILYK